jgi:hypothetical protein
MKRSRFTALWLPDDVGGGGLALLHPLQAATDDTLVIAYNRASNNLYPG